MTQTQYELTRYRPGEEAVLWQLYFDTTHIVIGRDYTPAQCRRWAPASKDLDEWASHVCSRDPFVARLVGRILGFGELESSGHIDHFYIHHEWQGKGVGRALYGRLEEEAICTGIPFLFLESSMTAMPFFAKMGFEITEEQEHFICDAPAKRFLMRKGLSKRHSEQDVGDNAIYPPGVER